MLRRLFIPILAGATLRDRMIACLGALLGIGLTGLVCGFALGDGAAVPLIVAPMGASAVLLFAVPTSPLAQPWPIVGGNTISAIVGLATGMAIGDPLIAGGVAVGLAIAVMSFTRSLHPPGGATALMAAIGGPAITGAGLLFPLVPVAANSLLLVALGYGFHRLLRHNYPHHATPTAHTHGTTDVPPQERVGFQSEDIDAALASLSETFDINRDDLERVLRRVELEAAVRSTRTLLCEDIMSRDVIRVEQDRHVAEAQSLLLGHNIRTLPVVDDQGKLLGTVGLRELATAAGAVGPYATEASTTAGNRPALSLLPRLTDGRTHAVIVVDEAMTILGLITQTDLLAATARFARPRAR